MTKDDHLIVEAFIKKMHKGAKDEEGDLMTHMKEKGMISKDARVTLPPHKTEEAEDMSKSPFHYDPMHGLASAANKIRDELRGAANDEARPEHIEKMAEIILGPQAEYASVDHYEKALSGVIELLNHYVVVPMNEYEETPEERQERVRRKWELNKQRWAKWKAENPEKARLNAQRKAGLYGKEEKRST